MKNKSLILSISALLIAFIFSSCTKDDYLDWKYLNENWLEEHKNDSGWIVDPSGVQYKVIYPGILEDTPNNRSFVTVQYSSQYINGDTIAQTFTIGEIISNTAYFVPGMQEILKKMQKEAVYELRVPYYLAHGKEGYYDILPYTTMIFKVKLLDFISYNPN